MASIRIQLEKLDAKMAELQQVVDPEDVAAMPIDLEIDENEMVEQPVEVLEEDDLPFDEIPAETPVTEAVDAAVEEAVEETVEEAIEEVAKEEVAVEQTVPEEEPAVVEDDEIQWGEDGYLYEEAEAESIDLIWSGSDFRLPIKIDANYSWTVKTPAWAEVDVPEDRVGEVTLNVMGVPSEYPLADASGKIQFMAGDAVLKEYTITIPGCEDIFSHSVSMGLHELVFNYAGRIKTGTGFIDGPSTSTITGTSGANNSGVVAHS